MGGTRPWGTRVAAQSSSRWFTFFFDNSASVKVKSASSKPVRELKGNQSVSDRATGGASGASEVRNSPCSLHRSAIENTRTHVSHGEVCENVYIPVRYR